MAMCTFCATDIPRGTGMIYVYKNGKQVNFCSRKCEKHATVLKHKGRDMKWVTSAGKDKSSKK
jgi:ribosomal protein L24E